MVVKDCVTQHVDVSERFAMPESRIEMDKDIDRGAEANRNRGPLNVSGTHYIRLKHRDKQQDDG
jgi:hypothetical protein